MEARRKLNEQPRDAAPEANPEQARRANTRSDKPQTAQPEPQPAKQPDRTPDERKRDTGKSAAGPTTTQQPSGEWTVGKGWVQNPQGYKMSHVPPEHVAASQRAAEQAQEAARAAGQKPA